MNDFDDFLPWARAFVRDVLRVTTVEMDGDTVTLRGPDVTRDLQVGTAWMPSRPFIVASRP